MWITLLILLAGFPIVCSYLIAIEQLCRRTAKTNLRVCVARQLRYDFGRGLVPPGAAPTDLLVTFVLLFAWLFTAGILIESLTSPERGEVSVEIARALFLLSCGFLDACRLIPPLRAARNRAETKIATRAILHSIKRWIVIGFALAGATVLLGSLGWREIVAAQANSGIWGIALQPLGALVFSGAALLNSGHDDDQIQAEGLIPHIKTTCLAVLFVTIYCGGWHFWGLTAYTTGGISSPSAALLCGTVLGAKVLIVLYGMVIVRVKSGARNLHDVLENSQNFLLPLAGFNFLIVLISAEWLEPSDYFNRGLLSWIITGGLASYFLLFHRRAATDVRGVDSRLRIP